MRTRASDSTAVGPALSSIQGGEPQVAEDRWLVIAATVFALGVLVHNLDHVRRGGSAVPADVFWIGTLAVFDEVAVVVLAFLRHRLAPAMALLSGVSLAAGYVLVHFTPERAWLSDSLISGGASPVSVIAAALETVTAIGLAVGAYLVLAERRRARADTGGSPLRRDALWHPVVLAMVAGNAFVLAMSLATR